MRVGIQREDRGMPEVREVPKGLRAFQFHGVEVGTVGPDDEQAVGTCPFCGKERKFHAATKTGLWDCKSCGRSGNPTTFLRQLWQASDEATEETSELKDSRGLLYLESAALWGVCKSILTGEWLVPGYGHDGKLMQLYRWAEDPKSGKRLLYATPGLHHGIHGIPQWDPSKPDVYVCEGPWDGMVLWESMRIAKWSDDGLSLTASPAASLLATANVLAAPGANVFQESWLPLFAGKRVFLLYDSDHPKPHPTTGVPQAPVGWDGMRRAASVLLKAGGAAEVHCLHWGVEGYDALRPSGTDVRDVLTAGKTPGERVGALNNVIDMLGPIPADWGVGRTSAAKRTGGTEIECEPCSDWETLRTAWRKAMKWTEGLDRGLSVMLASVTSTKALGDPLWVKIIGPASCGKSTLCEALSVNRQHVLAKSAIRGFHSGFQSDREGKEDNSLVAKLYDKTLITKDGDTLLQSPNVGQILSEARDLYDRTSRTHYRNKMGRDYSGVNMTWILCGTSSLRALDSSELGERFLDCVIMEGIDDDQEDEILLRVANRAERNVSLEANGSAETHNDPEMTRAMQLTGGYVSFLRGNASAMLGAVSMSEEALKRCIRLGKFVAYMRARPSLKQDETAEREFAARLVSQIIRLAKCLAVVLSRPSVDAEVMRRVRKVATDTARGRVLEITKHIYNSGEAGADVRSLTIWANERDDKSCQALLRFLKRIGVTEPVQTDVAPGVRGRMRWKLTPRLADLYRDAVVTYTHEDAAK